MKFDPGCILMLFIAILLDIFGIICTVLDAAFGIGEIFSWVSDIAGTVIIGGWLLFRSMIGRSEEGAKEKIEEVKNLREKRKGMEKIAQKMRKAGKSKKWLKYLRVGGIIGEYVPILGVLPFWTIIVIAECRK